MLFDKIKEKNKELLTDKRFKHVYRVVDKAIYLANIYNADVEKCKLAASLHDIAKYFDDEYAYSIIEKEYLHIFDNGFINNFVLHGFAGASFSKKNFNINDEEILNAIRFHTIGNINMSLIEKIIYLADAIEDERNYPRVDEIRAIAEYDLDLALLLETEIKFNYLIEKKTLIHPNTLLFRNQLLKKGIK